MPTNKNARVWTGTEWANISSPVAVPNAIAYYQSTAPSSPSTGQVWVNSTTETFYVWSGSAWEQQNTDLSAYLTSATAAATYVSAATVASTYAPKASPVFTGTVDASNANFVPPVQTSGRNKAINGGFDVWQRGTTFSSGGYTADRWLLQVDGSGATRSVSQQTFSPGNAIAGYEPKYFLRYNQTIAGTGATFNILDQRIEDVRTLAGQAVTVSFWAKADSSRTIDSSIQQVFDGSAEVSGLTSGTISLTTSWQRISYTGTLASISGKTVGANSYIAIRFNLPRNTIFTFDIWGVQIEKGSVATPFETEPYADILRKCQRYYELVAVAVATSSPAVAANILACSPFAVTKRTTPGTPVRITNDYFYGASGMATTTSTYIVKPEALTAYRTSSGTAGQTQFSELVAVSAEL